MVKFSRTRGLAVCVAAAGALATALYVGHWDKGSQSTKGIKQGLPHSADTDLLSENVAVGKAYTILDDKHSDHMLIFKKEGVNDLEEHDKERYEEVIKQKEELQKVKAEEKAQFALEPMREHQHEEPSMPQWRFWRNIFLEPAGCLKRKKDQEQKRQNDHALHPRKKTDNAKEIFFLIKDCGVEKGEGCNIYTIQETK